MIINENIGSMKVDLRGWAFNSRRSNRVTNHRATNLRGITVGPIDVDLDKDSAKAAEQDSYNF